MNPEASAALWEKSKRKKPSVRFVVVTAVCLAVVFVVYHWRSPILSGPEPAPWVYHRPLPIWSGPELAPWVYPEVPWKPPEFPRKALILGSYAAQDVSWLVDVPDDWEIYRYVNDDPLAEYKTPSRAGNEANAYLTFIIEHYNNLPDYMVFAHGHDRGWHQPEHTAQKVRALNLTALEESGYVSLHCTLAPGCTEGSAIHIKDPHANPDDPRWMLDVLPGFIEWMFPEIEEPPEVLMAPCCAQFAASKGQVLRRSKSWWKKYRRPLMQDLRLWSKLVWNAPGRGIGGYRAGIAYEKTYHLAFGKDPVYCPDADHCRKTFFSDAIHCDGETGRWQDSTGWENITCIDTLDD